MANQCCTDFTIIGPQTAICQALRLMISNLRANGVVTGQPPSDTIPINELASWVDQFAHEHFLEALSGDVTSRPYGDDDSGLSVYPYGSLYGLRLDFATRTIPATSEIESFVDSLPSPCGVYALSHEPNSGIRERLVILKENGVARRVRLSSEYSYYEDSLDKTNREIDRFCAQMHKAITDRSAPLPMKYCENAACANDVEALARAWKRRAPGQIDLNRVFRSKAYDSFVWLLKNKSARVSIQDLDTAKALLVCCSEGNVEAADAIIDGIPMDDREVKKAARAVGRLGDCDARTHVLVRLESMCTDRGFSLPEVSVQRQPTAASIAVDSSAAAIGEHRTLGGMGWTVVARDGSRLLLVAADRLRDDAGEVVRRGYNDEKTGVTWETCSLRGWLNGEFLNRFSDEERSMMVPAHVVNYDNEKVRTPGGNDTVDLVFCLSSVGFRALIEKGNRASFDATWLRSPGNVPDMATCVVDGLYGAVVWQDGFDVDTTLAVMPAMWVEEPRSTVGDAGFFSASVFEELPPPAKKRLAIAYLTALPSSTVGDTARVDVYLHRNFKRMIDDVVASPGAEAAIEGARKLGLVDAISLAKAIEAATRIGNSKTVEVLQSLAAEVTPAEKKARKANPWSVGELKKLWRYKDNGNGYLAVTEYKGSSSVAMVPRTIGKKTVVAGGEWVYSYYSFRVPKDRLAHVIMPETIAGIDWRQWGHPTVHALRGSSAYLGAMMSGLTVVGLEYEPGEKGSYERAAEMRAREIEDAAQPRLENEAFDAALTNDAKVGDIVALGRFPGTEVPVAWRVLATRSGGALLLSEYALSDMKLGRKGCGWSKSSARKWLNEEFLKDYFGNDEINKIVPYGSDAFDGRLADEGLLDGDRFFCLSVKEARRYLKSARERVAYTVPYLNGLIRPCSWWLRSPGSPDFHFAQVLGDGRILTKGAPPKELAGIRPAVYVRY